MKLYLVRHATASEKIAGPVRTDGERPLTHEGRQESELVANSLKRIGVRADLLLSSPLVRARQTAEIFAEVLAAKDKHSICDALAPGGSLTDIYLALSKQMSGRKNIEEIFLVGHQPDMTFIAQGLLWTGPDFDMPFEKCAVARIDIFDVPTTNAGTLKWMLTAKMCAALTGVGVSG